MEVHARHTQRLAQLLRLFALVGSGGVLTNFKVGFVLGNSVFNLYFWLTKSPTYAKPLDVVRNAFAKWKNQKPTIKTKLNS
jgi:hypothetical protein